jgi:hypothetical protein
MAHPCATFAPEISGFGVETSGSKAEIGRIAAPGNSGNSQENPKPLELTKIP